MNLGSKGSESDSPTKNAEVGPMWLIIGEHSSSMTCHTKKFPNEALQKLEQFQKSTAQRPTT